MGPVLTSEKGNSYVLVVCDYFSKYTEAYAIADMTAQTVADKIATEWVCKYRLSCVHSFGSRLPVRILDIPGIMQSVRHS